jgi:hypothetical protein
MEATLSDINAMYQRRTGLRDVKAVSVPVRVLAFVEADYYPSYQTHGKERGLIAVIALLNGSFSTAELSELTYIHQEQTGDRRE